MYYNSNTDTVLKIGLSIKRIIFYISYTKAVHENGLYLSHIMYYISNRHCALVTHIINYIWSTHLVQIKIRNGISVKYIIYYNLDTDDLHLT